MSGAIDFRVERKDRRLVWVAFGAILGLAFLVRLVAIDQGLWGDQLVVFQIAQLDWQELLRHVVGRETHPPLSYLLLHGWLWAGSSEAWARALFVLFGVGTCVVTFGLGRALAGQKFGLLAMAVVSVLPGAVWASRYLHSYIVGAFFAGAAAWSFVRLLQGRRSVWDWTLYGGLSALALHSFYFNGLLLAAQGLYGLAAGRRWRGWVGPLLISQGVAVASLLPLLKGVLQTLGSVGPENPMLRHKVGFYAGGIHIGGFIRSLTGAMGLDTLFLSGPLHNTWPRTLLLVGGLVVLVAASTLLYWGCGWLNGRGREKVELASGTWIATMLLVPVGLANVLHNFTPLAMLPHYFIPLAPFAACLWASAVAAIPHRWLAGAVAGLLVIFSGARLYAIYTDEGVGWRRAVPHIEARWQPGDGVLFLQGYLTDGYDFYASRQVPKMDLNTVLVEVGRGGAGPFWSSTAVEQIKARVGQFRRVWFFRAEPYHFQQEEEVAKWVQSQYRSVEERRFGQLVLTLLVMAPETPLSGGPISLRR